MPAPFVTHRTSLRRLAWLALALGGCDGALFAHSDIETDDPKVKGAPAAPHAGNADPASAREAMARRLFPKERCDDVYELRFHGPDGDEAPYVVAPGSDEQRTVSFDAPWGDESTRAIAYEPLIDNEDVTREIVLMTRTMRWLTAWAPDDEDALETDARGMDLPRGRAALVLRVHYDNATGSTAARDRSGFALCTVRAARVPR